MKENETLDSWDAFTGSFLKAEMIEDESIGLKVSKVEVVEDDDRMRPRLSLEKNGTELLFDLNKTNAEKCRELGVNSPKELLHRLIFFRKVLVTNPQTKKEVQSLRISKIQ